MYTKITTLICIFSLGYSNALQCFECDPRSGQSCLSPSKNNSNVTTCPETVQTTDPNAIMMTKMITQLSNNSTGVPQCYYLHFNSGSLGETGVYRGCVKCETNVVEFCESLNRRVTNGTVKYCHFCKTDGCNDRRYDSERAGGFVTRNLTGRKLFDVKNTRNSASETILSMLVLLLDFIICFQVARF